MVKILKTGLQKGLFIGAVILTVLTGFLAYANNSLGREWVNRDHDDYQSEPERYSVTQAPIKEFRTLNGSNCKSLSIVDFYRVCVVDVTFAGGQKMKFYVPRSKDDSIGDMISVAYEKKWDTDYSGKMKASDIDEDSILHTARTEKVTDGMYARLFTLLAVVSALFAAVVLFICYKKKDAYNL